jgi:hypothetical protein
MAALGIIVGEDWVRHPMTVEGQASDELPPF